MNKSLQGDKKSKKYIKKINFKIKIFIFAIQFSSMR